MTLTVCFDALGTCFSLQPVIDALEEFMGGELRDAGSDPRMTIMDWVNLYLQSHFPKSILDEAQR